MPPILLPRPPAWPNSFIASPTSVRSPMFSFEPVNLKFQLLHPSPHDLSSSWLPRATRKTPLGSAPNCAPSSDSEEDVIIVISSGLVFALISLCLCSYLRHLRSLLPGLYPPPTSNPLTVYPYTHYDFDLVSERVIYWL
ncbi:hypothetical protein BJY52DRAFT_1192739 [Lactarius psammicola]|nr:hypothetical protein BJY52DRAFT_1192739 [Lactarius psammicola]